MDAIAARARRASLAINKVVEVTCVALLALLVLDVWLGVLVRYMIPLPITFTEELARYIMIWMALLAVSSGIVYREHIGVEFVFRRFPPAARRWLAVAFDVIAFSFFAVLLVYGIGFVERGFSRVTMIYDVPRAYPYMVVPVAAGIACVQLVLVAVADLFGEPPEAAGAQIMRTDPDGPAGPA